MHSTEWYCKHFNFKVAESPQRCFLFGCIPLDNISSPSFKNPSIFFIFLSVELSCDLLSSFSILSIGILNNLHSFALFAALLAVRCSRETIKMMNSRSFHSRHKLQPDSKKKHLQCVWTYLKFSNIIGYYKVLMESFRISLGAPGWGQWDLIRVSKQQTDCQAGFSTYEENKATFKHTQRPNAD